jgi:glycosyltransferase involved in cell wall biosynthesis
MNPAVPAEWFPPGILSPSQDKSLIMAHTLKIIAVMGYESCYGAEKANLQVLSLLREAGAVVHCLVRSDGTGEKFIRLATERGFPVHPAGFGPSIFGLHCNLFRYLANVVGMARVSLSLRRLGNQVGATHIYIPNYLQFLYGWPALLLLRLPVVFRIGDPPERSALHQHLWTRVIAPRVSEFVTNSEFTRQRLISVCRRPVRSRVIRNCVAPRSLPVEASPETDRWNPAPMITYLGQMNASKGVDLAVEAAMEICQRHEEVCFQFVGVMEPASEFVESIRKGIADAGMSERIKFLPYVSDVVGALRGSVVHLCPSVQDESSANVVLDAKQAGVPSVVFPRGGLPELVAHKVDGYVCGSADAAGLVEGILYFLEDRESWARAAEAARLSVSRHAPAAILPEWVRVFEEASAV